MSYNKDAMAAYKQYGQSMIAGGGGSNLSGLGAKPAKSSMTTAPSGPVDFTTIDTKTGKQTKVATITDYGNDNDDGPTVLYTKAANAATAAGVDLVKAAAKPSVDPKLLYTEPRFNIEQQATKIEDYLRGTAIEDALYEAQGFEKPYTGLYIAEDRPMTEAELQKYKPLIDMADDIMNENITVEELGDMDREDQEAFLRAIGVQGLGPAKRESSFVGGDFDVATTEEEFVRDLLNKGLTKSDASYWDKLGDFRRQKEEAEEGVVDLSPPEAADQALIPITTATPDAAPDIDTTPPSQTGGGLMSRRTEEEVTNAFDDEVKTLIEKNEGKKNIPYKDTEGFWTVGIGHFLGSELPSEYKDANGEPKAISDAKVQELFNADYAKHKAEAEELPHYDVLDNKGKSVLIDLSFNMGGDKFNADKWPGFFGALEDRDIQRAADELVDSSWYRQTKSRGKRMVARMRQARFN